MPLPNNGAGDAATTNVSSGSREDVGRTGYETSLRTEAVALFCGETEEGFAEKVAAKAEPAKAAPADHASEKGVLDPQDPCSCSRLLGEFKKRNVPFTKGKKRKGGEFLTNGKVGGLRHRYRPQPTAGKPSVTRSLDQQSAAPVVVVSVFGKSCC